MTVAGEGRTGLGHLYRLNRSAASAGVRTTAFFLRFRNAVNSGRTCIYFGKLFKNDALTSTVDKTFFEKFGRQALVKSCEGHGEMFR